jgi:hypothetical protein
MTAVIIPEINGLSTHSNDLAAPVGSTSVADNVVFTREGRPERRTGFKDYSTNLPDFAPEQLIASASGDQAYLHLDDGIWYKDSSSGNWYRKRGAFGTSLSDPQGLAYSSGHLYVSTADNVILDINISTGARTILAGRFGATGAHTDGTGDSARFNRPLGLAISGDNLYVSDYNNHCIRKIVISTGVVTTPVGTTGTTSGHVDANGNSARFYSPLGLAISGDNLYVSEEVNNCIRKVVLSTGDVTTPVGTTGTTSGHVDATGNAARFNYPYGLAIDGDNLYVSEFSNNCIRKVVLSTGDVTTPVGTTGTTSGHVDATGNAARFNLPTGLAIDGDNLYVSESQYIRKVVLSTGVVTTPVGTTGFTLGHVDAIGNAARFSSPFGLAIDGDNLYVADFFNDAIRKVYLATSYVTTIDGQSGVSASSTGLPLTNGIIVGPT